MLSAMFASSRINPMARLQLLQSSPRIAPVVWQ